MSNVDPELAADIVNAPEVAIIGNSALPFAPGVVADPTDVRYKAVAGIKALGGRTLFTFVLRIFSSMCMARLLLPSDYGEYAFAGWVAGIAIYLSDVGLAGALVHQHATPSKDERLTVFLMQQIFTAAVSLALVVCAPQIVAYAKLPTGAGLLLRVMAFALFNCSLRTIPMMTLERALKFGVIAKIELVQSLINTAVNLFFAWRGYGAWALALGSLAGGAFYTVILWFVSPWKPAGHFRWAIVVRLARFGLPFQLNALMPVLMSGWIPVIVARYLGVAALGFANWAVGLATVPMMLGAVLNRVAFPSYSRLQADPAALSRYLATSMRRLLVLMTIPLAGAILLCPLLIPILFRTRWVPAIPLVQWFLFDTMVQVLTGIIGSAQNATGRPGDRLVVAASAGAGRWILGFIAVRTLGLAGVGPAAVLMGAAELIFSIALLRKRRPETVGLISQVFWRLFALGAALLLANWARLAIGPYRVSGAAAAIASFLVLAGLSGLVAPEAMVPLAELRAAARMFRAPAT